jgi:hypothetical protein
VPSWKLTILEALRAYGAYVSDTAGDRQMFAFETEAGSQYVQAGDSNPWVQFAIGEKWQFNPQGAVAEYPHEHYVGLLRTDRDGIAWLPEVWMNLRVLNPPLP